ncbi:MAG: hypothetical protein AB1486_17720 [Planctomycetota bacterium]
MRHKGTAVLGAMTLAVALAGGASGAEIKVDADISTSTTWTSNNTYNLQKQIYVLPGATLTIQAGTIVASDTGLGGSLAVCKGAQIFVQGTKANPVIMTSKADVATWVGGDPKTGTWREAANEWGNLTIMGAGYISENAIPGNVPHPDPDNVADMEGLVRGPATDRYGGGDDDDDSGSISYLSLRYGGKVIGLNNELNGLSLGGIGRETDIHHVDIMNNVDDGIEIWGGTVNLTYVSIWNVGDDSFDIDQGWRGKAQFGLLVQGYSLDAAQGSGVGDNCLETDGAEDSDWQPVTTTAIYNFTVIGQPVDGDHGTAWRDNARVQYHNSIFMDIGEQVVKFDNVDGDGGNGYGFNGTLSWPATWTTDYDAAPPHANDPPNWGDFYKSQTSGKLAEIRDSVFFRNLFVDAYTEANNRGVFDPANNNILIPGFDPADAPIVAMTRGGPVTKGGKTMLPVTYLDPRPANEALTSVEWAPEDGFFASAHYRGAFPPDLNWLCGWTASQAFGFTPTDCQWSDLGYALAGTQGDPLLSGTGTLAPGSAVNLKLRSARPNTTATLIIGLLQVNIPFKGGYLVPSPDVIVAGLPTGALGELTLPGTWPSGIPSGLSIYFQYWIADPLGVQGFAASNGLAATQP